MSELDSLLVLFNDFLQLGGRYSSFSFCPFLSVCGACLGKAGPHRQTKSDRKGDVAGRFPTRWLGADLLYRATLTRGVSIFLSDQG